MQNLCHMCHSSDVLISTSRRKGDSSTTRADPLSNLNPSLRLEYTTFQGNTHLAVLRKHIRHVASMFYTQSKGMTIFSVLLFPSFTNPFFHFTISHGDLSCRGPLGPPLLKYFVRCLWPLRPEALSPQVSKLATRTKRRNRTNNCTLNTRSPWIQQKNLKPSKSLRCSPFTPTNLSRYRHPKHGRFVHCSWIFRIPALNF
jgi:hypothetical protein